MVLCASGSHLPSAAPSGLVTSQLESCLGACCFLSVFRWQSQGQEVWGAALVPIESQGGLFRSICLIYVSTMTVGGDMCASDRQYTQYTLLQGSHEETLVLAVPPPPHLLLWYPIGPWYFMLPLNPQWGACTDSIQGPPLCKIGQPPFPQALAPDQKANVGEEEGHPFPLLLRKAL